MTVRDDVVAGRSPESPSHPLSVVADGAGSRVALGAGNAVALDRDVVVRWPVAMERAKTTLDLAGPRASRLKDAHALVTLVPPRADATGEPVPRDLTLLLDTSGSMGGPPLEQAKRVSLALIDTLGPRDRFEAIEFSSSPRRFHASMLAATPENKRAVSAWLRDLAARGGTEMRDGILEALRPRDARAGTMSQVVLVTDGLIGFEQEIVREVLALLPTDARLHTVGVGSSVNRSLTGPAARAGRGVEVVIGLGEDPERAVTRLLARSVAPVVAEIEATGSALLETAPAKVPDLFAGAPVLLSARVRPEGGEIVLRGKTATGAWEERIRVPSTREGEGGDAVVTLFGRESVEDAEMRVAGGLAAQAGDAIIESVGLAYRIATRLTSWVAIDSHASVDPRDPTRRVEMPQALPFGTSVESFGLRSRAVSAGYGAVTRAGMLSAPPQGRASPAPARPAAAGPPPSLGKKREDDDEELAERAAAPRRPSFIERVAGAFTGRARAVVVWFGRIVSASGGRVIVEITVDGRALAWQPAAAVVVMERSGATRSLLLDLATTTREGTYEPGTTVRFVLQVPADFDASSIAHVIVGGTQVEIR